MRKGERLEKMIENSKFKNVSQLSKASGVPYTTIKSFIERDLHRASIDNVVKIAKSLNVSVEYLIGEDEQGVREVPLSKYNFFPTSISAGLPFDVDGITLNDVEKISIPDTLMGKWAGNKDIFITRINGDSMNQVMPDNSMIAVKKVELEELKDGDIVIYSNDHDYSCKRFFKDGERLIFRPDSTEKKFTDQIYTENDNITIHGKVVLYIVELD